MVLLGSLHDVVFCMFYFSESAYVFCFGQRYVLFFAVVWFPTCLYCFSTPLLLSSLSLYKMDSFSAKPVFLLWVFPCIGYNLFYLNFSASQFITSVLIWPVKHGLFYLWSAFLWPALSVAFLLTLPYARSAAPAIALTAALVALIAAWVITYITTCISVNSTLYSYICDHFENNCLCIFLVLLLIACNVTFLIEYNTIVALTVYLLHHWIYHTSD